jgi:acyl-[acyl carrier protein]--UDP-N-acetylglucosamine O-acyltransferase
MNSLNPEYIATELSLKILGSVQESITGIGFPGNHSGNMLCWAGSEDVLNDFDSGYVIIHHSLEHLQEQYPNLCLLSTMEKPRLVYARAFHRFFHESAEPENHVGIHRANPAINIGDYVFIGANVTIGPGTVIHSGSSILAGTQIGANCIIRNNTSLGTEGLGLEFDHQLGRYIPFPQIGRVVLEDYVDIGPHSTARRAAMGTTLIGYGSKIGSFVNIGHNCSIGKHCILTSHVCLAGSVEVGDFAFISIGTTIRNKVSITDHVVIGQGSVVTKSLSEPGTYYGHPAVKVADSENKGSRDSQ